MLNKFFLDNDYTVQMLLNEQVPISMTGEIWDNSIAIEIDADDTSNQYMVVDNGVDTDVLTVIPGQVNLLQVTEAWWAYGGTTTITPYKNGEALTEKVIDITFPDTLSNAEMISSTEADSEGDVLVGQHYEMLGSEYAEEAVQEIQQEVQNLQENKQEKLTAGSGISIDPQTNTISATGGGGGGNINIEQMDYAQFDGVGYFSLPYTVNADYRIEVDFEIDLYKSPQSVYGNSTGTGYTHLTQYNNGWYTGTGVGEIGFTDQMTGRHTFVENDNGHNKFDDTIVSTYTPTTISGANILVGNRIGSGAFNGKLYSFRIVSISTGQIICNLIPILETIESNGIYLYESGIYDTVSRALYKNGIQSVGNNS